jgi:hypothetical protein
MGNNQMPASYIAPPAVKAVVSKMSENGTVSSMFSLSQNTTAIEVSAQGATAAFRWVANADAQNSVAATSVIAVAGTTANFDHVVPANSMRRFVVPIEVNNPQGYGSMVGANIENGLFRWFAWKTQGVGSVFLTEYGSSNSY